MPYFQTSKSLNAKKNRSIWQYIILKYEDCSNLKILVIDIILSIFILDMILHIFYISHFKGLLSLIYKHSNNWETAGPNFELSK